jgi:hypothetical protein
MHMLLHRLEGRFPEKLAEVDSGSHCRYLSFQVADLLCLIQPIASDFQRACGYRIT